MPARRREQERSHDDRQRWHDLGQTFSTEYSDCGGLVAPPAPPCSLSFFVFCRAYPIRLAPSRSSPSCGPVSARRYPRGAAAVSCRLFPAALPTLLLLSGFCVVSARMRQRPTPVSRRAAGSLRLRHSFGRLVPLYMPPCRPRPTRQAVHQVPALHLGGGGGREGG